MASILQKIKNYLTEEVKIGEYRFPAGIDTPGAFRDTFSDDYSIWKSQIGPRYQGWINRTKGPAALIFIDSVIILGFYACVQGMIKSENNYFTTLRENERLGIEVIRRAQGIDERFDLAETNKFLVDLGLEGNFKTAASEGFGIEGTKEGILFGLASPIPEFHHKLSEQTLETYLKNHPPLPSQ